MPHVKPRLGPGWAVTFVALGLVVPLLAVMGLRFQMVKETRTKAEAYEAFKLATTELHSRLLKNPISQKLTCSVRDSQTLNPNASEHNTPWTVLSQRKGSV